MARTLQISMSPEDSERVTRTLVELPGVIGVAVNKGGSLKPEGDVVTVNATNEGVQAVLRALAREVQTGCSVVSSEPRSVVSQASQTEIDSEGDEASWPEMAAKLRRETNMTTNYLMAMFFAGIVAAAGIWTSTIHIVVGAMVIAPGFEPIMRIPFSILARDRNGWQQGLSSTGGGYLAIIAGGALGAIILARVQPLASPFGELRWVEYWSTFSVTSLVIAFAAGAAGAAVIAAHRSVLTAGVMIALALIPTATMTGMALAGGELELAAKAAARWAADAVLVALAGALVFGIKRAVLPDPSRLGRVTAPLQRT